MPDGLMLNAAAGAAAFDPAWTTANHSCCAPSPCESAQGHGALKLAPRGLQPVAASHAHASKTHRGCKGLEGQDQTNSNEGRC
jgi:hypothetical protein